MAEIKTKKVTPSKIKTVKTAPKKVVAKTVKKEVAPIKVAETKPVVAKYLNKNLKISPRKLRLTANNIKSMDPATAITRLKFTNNNAARILVKCVEDAVASAKHNYNLLASSLKFSEIRVDEGMKIKRMDKSHGSRFARGIIQKRHSRLTIILSGTIQS